MIVKGSNADLVQALVARRRTAWQAVAMGLLAAGCGVWRLARPGASGSFPTLALVLGLVAFTILAAVYWTRTQDINSRVDDLILCGVSPAEEGTVVAAEMTKRLAVIEAPRARRRLADSLRRHLESAEKASEPQAPGAPPRLVSQLDPSERRVLLVERSLVEVMVDRIEQSEVDPRALILLERVAEGTPQSLIAGGDAGDVLERRLHRAWNILAEDGGLTSRSAGVHPRALNQG